MPRPRQFDEERVLAAVQAAFWDNGYAGAPPTELAQRCQPPKLRWAWVTMASRRAWWAPFQ